MTVSIWTSWDQALPNGNKKSNSLIFRSIIELKKLLHFEYPIGHIWTIKMRNLNLSGTKLMINVGFVASRRKIHEIFFRSLLWSSKNLCYPLINCMHKSWKGIIKFTNLNLNFLFELIKTLDSLIDLWLSSTLSHYNRWLDEWMNEWKHQCCKQAWTLEALFTRADSSNSS